jgi:hypothetical protein
LWSVRVGRRFRALAKDRPEALVWFWIGPHGSEVSDLKFEVSSIPMGRILAGDAAARQYNQELRSALTKQPRPCGSDFDHGDRVGTL